MNLNIYAISFSFFVLTCFHLSFARNHVMNNPVSIKKTSWFQESMSQNVEGEFLYHADYNGANVDPPVSPQSKKELVYQAKNHIANTHPPLPHAASSNSSSSSSSSSSGLTKELTKSDLQRGLKLKGNDVENYILNFLSGTQRKAANSPEGLGIDFKVVETTVDKAKMITATLKPIDSGYYALRGNWKEGFVNNLNLQIGEEISIRYDETSRQFIFRITCRLSLCSKNPHK